MAWHEMARLLVLQTIFVTAKLFSLSILFSALFWKSLPCTTTLEPRHFNNDIKKWNWISHPHQLLHFKAVSFHCIVWIDVMFIWNILLWAVANQYFSHHIYDLEYTYALKWGTQQTFLATLLIEYEGYVQRGAYKNFSSFFMANGYTFMYRIIR